MMTENLKRRLPVGIQSFEKIRKEGFLYVDKTDMIWKLANNNKMYNYLSRPRRFGKSVLVDTLQAYFEGKKVLFEGLKIMDMEKEWKHYPVIRLDMSRGGANADTLRSYMDMRFEEYEKIYDIAPKATANLADRFHGIITTACNKTGLQVAILIDEYDYWAASGATSLLPKFVDDLDIKIKDLDNSALISSVIETSDVRGGRTGIVLVSVWLSHHQGIYERHVSFGHSKP